MAKKNTKQQTKKNVAASSTDKKRKIDQVSPSADEETTVAPTTTTTTTTTPKATSTKSAKSTTTTTTTTTTTIESNKKKSSSSEQPASKKKKQNNEEATTTAATATTTTTESKKKTTPKATLNASDATSTSTDRHTLHVSNVSPKTTRETIQNCMSEIGTVKDVMMNRANSVTLVTFASELTDEALEFNGAVVDGKPLTIRFATGADKRVYLSNLATSVSTNDVHSYINEIGAFVSVKDVTKEIGTANKAFLIEFKDYKSAIESLQWTGAHIRGRPSKWTLALHSQSLSANAASIATA